MAGDVSSLMKWQTAILCLTSFRDSPASCEKISRESFPFSLHMSCLCFMFFVMFLLRSFYVSNVYL